MIQRPLPAHLRPPLPRSSIWHRSKLLYTKADQRYTKFSEDNHVDEPLTGDNQVSEPVADDNQVNEPVADDNRVSEPVANDNQASEPVAKDNQVILDCQSRAF